MLNLARVFAQEGSVPVSFELDRSDLDFHGTTPFRQPITVTGVIENRAGVVTLRGTASFVYSACCDRCGQPVDRAVELPLEHVIVTGTQSETDDTYVVAEDMQLDEQALVREDVVLWVPLKFLCAEDCKGLCPICGKNRNEGDCGCEQHAGDPRLAALGSLLQDE